MKRTLEFTHVPEGDYLTSDDFASAEGISPATARRWCVDGKVEAYKVGRAWLIRKDTMTLKGLAS